MATPVGSAAKRHREVPQLNILVVDDDTDVCEYLEDFLTSEGYSVKIVNDPTKALSALREDEFHVVVLDLMMPKVSGILSLIHI